jgi:hypothetical protein
VDLDFLITWFLLLFGNNVSYESLSMMFYKYVLFVNKLLLLVKINKFFYLPF